MIHNACIHNPGGEAYLAFLDKGLHLKARKTAFEKTEKYLYFCIDDNNYWDVMLANEAGRYFGLKYLADIKYRHKPEETHFADPTQATNENIAAEASKLVLGDRNDQYGNPGDDYRGTSMIWTGFLNAKLKPGEVITPKEAILMMALMKINREHTKPKRDSRTDAIGYILCADWVETGVKPQPIKE
jgi:hypothetical protein